MRTETATFSPSENSAYDTLYCNALIGDILENSPCLIPFRLLHVAALWDNADLLEDLLHGEEIACLNARDSWGRSAMHAAATNADSKCLRILAQVRWSAIEMIDSEKYCARVFPFLRH